MNAWPFSPVLFMSDGTTRRCTACYFIPGGQCGNVAEVILTIACVHEHADDTYLCTSCAAVIKDFLNAGAYTCQSCLDWPRPHGRCLPAVTGERLLHDDGEDVLVG